MIKWIILYSVRLIDIMLVVACSWALYELPIYISLPFIFLTYWTWRSQGGAIAWTQGDEFIENASRYGL